MSLKISFKDRSVYRAPLEVLQHLYYYTTQYGLSVAQFTGAHQDFWEALPKELSKAKHSTTDLDTIIKKLEGFSAGSEKRLIKRREQKDKKWAEKEIVLNAQLLSVLAALPHELLAKGFQELTSRAILPDSLKLVDLVLKKRDDSDAFYFVDPDILLLGDKHLLMVELKTRGGATSSRNYPPSQLLNYFRLIAECQDANDTNLPKTFSHLILVPSQDLKWIEKNSDWVISANNEEGRLVVDPDACIIAGSGKTSFNHQRVKKLLIDFPIYYRSWEELEKAFRIAISNYNDSRNNAHWNRLCEELAILANTAGKYK